MEIADQLFFIWCAILLHFMVLFPTHVNINSQYLTRQYLIFLFGLCWDKRPSNFRHLSQTCRVIGQCLQPSKPFAMHCDGQHISNLKIQGKLQVGEQLKDNCGANSNFQTTGDAVKNVSADFFR